MPIPSADTGSIASVKKKGPPEIVQSQKEMFWGNWRQLMMRLSDDGKMMSNASQQTKSIEARIVEDRILTIETTCCEMFPFFFFKSIICRNLDLG